MKLIRLIMLALLSTCSFAEQPPSRDEYIRHVTSGKRASEILAELELVDAFALGAIDEIKAACDKREGSLKRPRFDPLLEQLDRIKGNIENGYSRYALALTFYGILPDRQAVGLSVEGQERCQEIQRAAVDHLLAEPCDQDKHLNFVRSLLNPIRGLQAPFFEFLCERLKLSEEVKNPNLLHCFYGELWFFVHGRYLGNPDEVLVDLSKEIRQIIDKKREEWSNLASESQFLQPFLLPKRPTNPISPPTKEPGNPQPQDAPPKEGGGWKIPWT